MEERVARQRVSDLDSVRTSLRYLAKVTQRSEGSKGSRKPASLTCSNGPPPAGHEIGLVSLHTCMERLRRNAGFNHSISTPDHAHQVASLETSMIDNSQPIEREHGKQSSSDNARRSAYSDPLSPRRRALSTQTVAKMILPDKESPSSPLSSCPDSPPSSPLNSAAVSAPLPRSTRKALHLDTSSSEVSAASRSRRAVAAGSKNVESKASLTSAVLSYADAKTKLKAKAPPSATTTSKPTVSAASEERWGPGQRRLAADSPFAPDAIDATLTLTRPKKFTRGLVLPKSSSSDGFVAQKSNGPSRGDNGPQLSAKEKQMLCVAQKGKPQEQSRPLQRKEYAETVKCESTLTIRQVNNAHAISTLARMTAH